ncbi:MAG TPA: hypothetical protein VKU39_21995, partial [Streptosporangiaceae bacterium]|nr:hypothetical protein [Streptosporangiaceae bacterium]
GVFNSGLTARAAPARDARYDYAQAPPELVQRATQIAAICEQQASSLPAAAMAFPLGHAAIVSVCVGAQSPEQVKRNARLHRAPPLGGLWAQLKAAGLLRADAPVPIGLGTCRSQP